MYQETFATLLGNPRLLAVLGFLFGAAIGSFLNVVIYRLPILLKREGKADNKTFNLAWPGSHCPQCKKPIRWYDNVPILSWLLLRGRCRNCKNPISPRYPLVEIVCAAATAILAVLDGLTMRLGIHLLATWGLIVLVGIGLCRQR